MSTNSCVIIKLRQEDIGKPIKFDKALLPDGVKIEDWVLKDPNTGNIWHDESTKEKSKTIIPTGKYIGIYCHWDGHKSSVGNALKTRFSNYIHALNLLAGGWCSAISKGSIKHYANRKGERWGIIQPVFGDTPQEIMKNIDFQYCYLLDEKGWRCYDTNYKAVRFLKY
jgi:hypothetical protein